MQDHTHTHTHRLECMLTAVADICEVKSKKWKYTTAVQQQQLVTTSEGFWMIV